MYTHWIIGICIIAIIYFVITERKAYHPAIIFNTTWLLIIALDSLHLYKLLYASENIYRYIFYGLLFFNIGVLIVSLFRKNNKIVFTFGDWNRQKGYKIEYIPRYRLLYLLGTVAIVFYLGSSIKTIKYLMDGMSLGQIRALVQATNNTNVDVSMIHKLINAISVIIIIPGSYVVQVVGCMDFWIGKKDKKLFAIACTVAFLSSMSEGGRTALVNIIIYMMIGFWVSNYGERKEKNFKLNEKYKKMIFLVIITSLISFLGWFTFSRTGKTLSKNLYLYFSMQPYMFNIWADKVDAENLYGYSEASLNGFSFFILYIVKNFFGVDFPKHWNSIYQLIRMTDSEWQVITHSGTKANAYVSIFWFFYLDGRLWGIILGLFLYGAFIARKYCDVKNFTNIKNLTIFAYVYQGLLYSFIRFPFSNIYYSIAYILLVILVFETKKRKEEDDVKKQI